MKSFAQMSDSDYKDFVAARFNDFDRERPSDFAYLSDPGYQKFVLDRFGEFNS